jgi:putative ABC transport system permease protein
MLIACANVANLLLSRAAVRQKEIAIRTALGSGRGRIVRLLLAESLVLALGGAALGLGVAYGLMEVFNHYIQRQTPPYWMVFKIDHVSILYICTLAIASSLLAGLWPALRASRSDLTTALKDGGRGSTTFSLSRFSRLMVVGEVVLSCVLLVLSGLYVRSVIKIQGAPLGFSTAGIFTNRVGLPEAGYKTAAQQGEFYTRLLEVLGARADVESVAISNVQPTWNNRSSIQLEGRAVAPGTPRIFASQVYVSGSYFSTLGIQLLQGRTFDQRDSATAPKVAIVSTRFAEKYWPGQGAIGRKFTYESGNSIKAEDWITVVGVVAPTLQGEFNRDDGETPQAYLPYTQQRTLRFMTVFTKARVGDGAALASSVRAAVRSLDDDLPIYWPQTFEAMVEDAKFFKKLFAWIFGIFGGVALLLSGIGLYGVMAYSVSQRTQEIGVRMALGASPGAVMRLIVREGGVRLAIGLVLGLVLGYFAAGLQRNFLYDIQPADVPTFVATFLTLATAGLAACIIPALRALRINPVEALRAD